MTCSWAPEAGGGQELHTSRARLERLPTETPLSKAVFRKVKLPVDRFGYLKLPWLPWARLLFFNFLLEALCFWNLTSLPPSHIVCGRPHRIVLN